MTKKEERLEEDLIAVAWRIQKRKETVDEIHGYIGCFSIIIVLVGWMIYLAYFGEICYLNNTSVWIKILPFLILLGGSIPWMLSHLLLNEFQPKKERKKELNPWEEK